MPLDAFRCVGLVWNVGQTCRLYVGGTSMVPAAQTAHYECGHLIWLGSDAAECVHGWCRHVSSIPLFKV